MPDLNFGMSNFSSETPKFSFWTPDFNFGMSKFSSEMPKLNF